MGCAQSADVANDYRPTIKRACKSDELESHQMTNNRHNSTYLNIPISPQKKQPKVRIRYDDGFGPLPRDDKIVQADDSFTIKEESVNKGANYLGVKKDPSHPSSFRRDRVSQQSAVQMDIDGLNLWSNMESKKPTRKMSEHLQVQPAIAHVQSKTQIQPSSGQTPIQSRVAIDGFQPPQPTPQAPLQSRVQIDGFKPPVPSNPATAQSVVQIDGFAAPPRPQHQEEPPSEPEPKRKQMGLTVVPQNEEDEYLDYGVTIHRCDSVHMARNPPPSSPVNSAHSGKASSNSPLVSETKELVFDQVQQK